jgi:hypothetical protein
MSLPIGIFYEHPEWFRKLFATLDERGLPYEKLHAGFHRFDPADLKRKYSVVLNSISSSSYLR